MSETNRFIGISTLRVWAANRMQEVPPDVGRNRDKAEGYNRAMRDLQMKLNEIAAQKAEEGSGKLREGGA